MPTANEVADALRALKAGRTHSLWVAYVKRLLAKHGGGATRFDQVDPAHYRALFAAAGGTILTKPTRPMSALEADLRQRLSEGVKQPRPTGRVNYGCNLLSNEKPTSEG